MDELNQVWFLLCILKSIFFVVGVFIIAIQLGMTWPYLLFFLPLLVCGCVNLVIENDFR